MPRKSVIYRADSTDIEMRLDMPLNWSWPTTFEAFDRGPGGKVHLFTAKDVEYDRKPEVPRT